MVKCFESLRLMYPCIVGMLPYNSACAGGTPVASFTMEGTIVADFRLAAVRVLLAERVFVEFKCFL